MPRMYYRQLTLPMSERKGHVTEYQKQLNSRTVSEFKCSLQLIKCWSCPKVMSRFVSLVGQYILFSLQYMLKYIIIKQKWRLDVSDYSVNIGLLENTAVVRILVRHHLSDINEIWPQCFMPFFIGPESDHWLCLSLTPSLTHSLTDSRLV